MEPITIGLDIAKNVFQLHAVDPADGTVLRKQLRRRQVLAFFAAREPSVIGIEACCTAHYWARELMALGHEVRLLPPSYVKPYVKRGKNDAVDAEAIWEAMDRATMRFVPVKTAAQQAALSRHRVRDLLVRQRTMLVNALRSQMAEFGMVAPAGRHRLATLIEALSSQDDTPIPTEARVALCELAGAIAALAPRIDRIDKEIIASVRSNELARRLMTIPGIGPIIASAIVAMVGDPHHFRNGRHFAAWLGLVARQNSSGGKTRLGRISKMGDRYLRKLLVLGATSVLRQAAGPAHSPLGHWIKSLLQRRPPRLVTVALANKMARIAWAVMAHHGVYRPALAAKA